MSPQNSRDSPQEVASGFTSGPVRRRPVHRACDYCREHRIKCEYPEGSSVCEHCETFDIDCEKVAPPPRDSRPRKRFRANSITTKQYPSQGLEPTYLGPTSIAQLILYFNPPNARGRLHSLDQENRFYRGAICDAEEQGLLVGRDEIAKARRDPQISFETAHARLAQAVGAQTVLTDLYETASTRIIPVFPVISKHESLLDEEPNQKYWDSFVELHHNSRPPTPLPRIVRLIHCALATMSRTVPTNIRDNVLSTLQTVVNGEEFEEEMKISVISNVQILVLMSMCDDLYDSPGASWLKLGTAIRMSQELALHRDIGVDFAPLAQRNRRARVWGACLCADRWMSLIRGQSVTIDLDMCDALPPQDYPDHVRQTFSGHWTPAFRFLTEFTRLSTILGRVYQLLYTPRGLHKADDATLLLLQNDIDIWWAQAPTSFPYSPTLDISEAPQLNNIFFVAVEFTFYRPFLWPSGPIPSRIAFRPLPLKWPGLVNRAKQAVTWAETAPGQFYLDVWSIVMYPMICCLLIHLKVFQATRTADARSWLDRSQTIIQIWAEQLPANHERREIAAMARLIKDTAGEIVNAMDTISDSHNDPPPDITTPSGSLNREFFEMLDCLPFRFDQQQTIGTALI